MSIKLNCNRSGCKDVFKSFLVANAEYDGILEIPIIKPIEEIPSKLLSFLEVQKAKDFHQWLHFYIDDFHFDKVWYKINQFIEMFKRFDGIILPDFSVYRDMPLCMQYWNIYRSRALGCYLQSKGIKVIPNVRYGDERTYDVSTLGLSNGQTIAIKSILFIFVVCNLIDMEVNNGWWTSWKFWKNLRNVEGCFW